MAGAVQLPDAAAAQHGRAASSAQLTAHLSQRSFPAPEKPGVEEAEPAVALDAMEVLAANASRGPWPRWGRGSGRTGSSWMSR
ncbi:hypothetical protein [Streptomyces sp. NPDC003090]|uniref:hypothetical protein n=1 Tax=Streptomyces sp. NPDC003090 TaxID=3154274 RepID=UPI0038223E5D